MDTTYHSNIPIETLSLLDCDVKNFNFILHNYTPLTMTNIQENCMKVNVKLNFLFIVQVQAFTWRKLF